MKKNKFFFIFLFLTILVLSFISSAESDYGDLIQKQNYEISRSKIDRTIEVGGVFRDYIEITNLGNTNLDISFSVDEALFNYLDLENFNLLIPPKEKEILYFLIKGNEEGEIDGNLIMRGEAGESIPIHISIVDEDLTAPVLFETVLLKNQFILGKEIKFQVNVNKLKNDLLENVSFYYYLMDENNKTFNLFQEEKDVENSFQEIKTIAFSEELVEGNYILVSNLIYQSSFLEDKSEFILKKSFFQILLFGFLPMWVFLIIIGSVLFLGLLFYLIRRHIESKKKYKMRLDLKTIPKKNNDFFFLGRIAEKKNWAYLDPHRLTTHSIVAGATGGGKSISAQVIIEEALLHNIAVIVFDPTAQWSGMLRKCTDKKMMSYYSKFGLKETDARAFKGNVRQVNNARELIDIEKFITPGQIQIFSLNKLDPKDMDIFVSNVIRQIFKSDPKEYPTLRTLIVFDEVHRLLPKFGGNGEGFLQIERGCREFRKWGLGIMLISQVLNDFVGEIKANISTEVQMRTRDEGDLGRINTKYGEEFLQSLVKASVGVGMFENPAYNHAQPYFVNFRPILHSTRRLSDEELEKYNQYNNMVDDIEFDIEQLETEKVDTFDLKMELKLVKDKIMSGSFSVVEIYLEGLKPRVAKEWEKLGKKPKKREIKLVDEAEIRASIEEARKQKEKIQKQEAKNVEAKEEAEKKEEDLSVKEVAPITFDNGMMIGSVKELLGVLPNLDGEIFKIHVNQEKNDIKDWITKNFGEEEGNKLNGILTKEDLVKALGDFGKKKGTPKKVEKKKEDKKEEKNSEEEKSE